MRAQHFPRKLRDFLYQSACLLFVDNGYVISPIVTNRISLLSTSMGSYVVYGFSDEPSSMPLNRHRGRVLFTLWEIIPATASAVITTCYAIQYENAVDPGKLTDAGSGTLPCLPTSTWALNPGPGMMLGACLTFGCSISSISYRRQELDRYQTVFFVVAICVACTLGATSGSNPNLIMLGYIPWGLCVGIVASAVGHWAMRQCGMNTGLTHNKLEDNKLEDNKMAW